MIVEVGGVGYRVSVPTSLLAALGGPGSEVFLHVHTHVREDAIVLYGFAHADERRCFEALLGAHGVGPSLALAILSSLSPAALVHRGARGRRRHPVPGARGREEDRRPAAARAQGPARPPDPRRADGPAATGPARPAARSGRPWPSSGYGPEEIRGALDAVDEDGSVEEMVRSALRELARSR